MRQRRWLELVKDYDWEILYHLGRANMVAYALSRRTPATLMSLRELPRHLQEDIRKLDIEVYSRKLSSLTLQLKIFDGIKGA